MSTKLLVPAMLVAAAGVLAAPRFIQPDDKLPQPPIVTPGKPASDAATPAPSDAVVLFDGTSMDKWQNADGKGAATWKAEGKAGGAMQCVPGTGSVTTKDKFGDMQLHVEFATPAPNAEKPETGQGRGNSGVYLQGRYEVQVLDSFKNTTYANGQCASIYGQYAPLVNVSRAPGEWQSYDIVFHAARWDGEKMTAKPRVTVLHNGVLVQDNVEINGTTGSAPGKFEAGDGPIYLQDHGNLVKYRNIWVRPLKVSVGK